MVQFINIITSLICINKLVLHYTYRHFFYHLINKLHHITFDLIVRFIDQMIETNLWMVQDLFQLRTI